MITCGGCENFQCALKATHYDLIDDGEGWELWLKRHNFYQNFFLKKRRRFRLGKSNEKRQLRIQAQGVLANGRLRQMASSPFVEALLAVKTMAENDPNVDE